MGFFRREIHRDSDQPRVSTKASSLTTMTFAKKEPPEWLLAFWKEVDDKTFGKGFDCFTEDAIGNLGVADWHGREAGRASRHS